MNAEADDLDKLREKLQRFERLADTVPVGMAYFEAASFVCRFSNRVYAETFGLDTTRVLGMTFAQIIGADAAARIEPQVQRLLQHQEPQCYERELPGADGQPRRVEVHLLPDVGATGAMVGAFVLLADITHHHRTEAALRKSEERLAKFMQASAEGIVFHQGGFITDVNPPLLQMLGYELEEMMGRRTLEFIAEDERARVAQVIAAGTEITYDSVALHKDGQRIPVEFIVRTMEFPDARLRMTIVRDRRDRVEAERRIRHLAQHDELTGLPNRSSFRDRVQALIERGRDGAPAGFALLFIDLDHFKRVNDSLGHLVGDTLLQTVARRIAATLRSRDLVARFGGDEFVVVLEGSPGEAAVLEVAAKLQGVVAEAVDMSGSTISVTPSIGVALYPQHGSSVDQLLKHADTAMYEAKQRGRAQMRFFEPHMERAAQQALELEGQLAQALNEQQFVLHFQPQVSLHDGRVIGAEALIRWRHPQRGLIEPAEFLPVAEARRLMLPIGDWVLDEALRQAARWRALGLLTAPMAINVSGIQLAAPGFVDTVLQALAHHGPAVQLELELTERMLMDDLPTLRERLHRLRRGGVRIAVDDFGTGYSSLAHLKDLPLDRLKVDRSFVHDLPRDRGSAAIARAIIQLAGHLGLQVVAEGVETEAQRAWILAYGGDEAQGHLCGPPMPAEAFEAWLRQRPGAPVLA